MLFSWTGFPWLKAFMVYVANTDNFHGKFSQIGEMAKDIPEEVPMSKQGWLTQKLYLPLVSSFNN